MTKVSLLKPYSQNYDWGKLGSTSKVAQLIATGYGTQIDENKPYAELWMGYHSNGPCFVVVDGEGHSEPISAFLKSRELGSIDYLFKVLSVRKALSIQSHPDADLAKKLNASYPDIYKDPNPKPELAIALTEFRALFGFRPLDQIAKYIRTHPALQGIVGEAAVINLEEWGGSGSLKMAYSALMRADQHLITEAIEQVVASNSADPAVELARELNRQFPGGDVGVLSVFFLNIVDLSPGECLFMGPNVPHAYISGDLVECMTCSDNVIRGGLTPKFKDVDTLITSLNYTATIPQLLLPENNTYDPKSAVPFAVSRYPVKAGESTVISTASSGPSIALIMSGSGLVDTVDTREGQSLILHPNSVINISASADMDVFVAFNPL